MSCSTRKGGVRSTQAMGPVLPIPSRKCSRWLASSQPETQYLLLQPRPPLRVSHAPWAVSLRVAVPGAAGPRETHLLLPHPHPS